MNTHLGGDSMWRNIPEIRTMSKKLTQFHNRSFLVQSQYEHQSICVSGMYHYFFHSKFTGVEAIKHIIL